MNCRRVFLIVVFVAFCGLNVADAQVGPDDARVLNWMPPSGPQLKDTHWRVGTFPSEAAATTVGYYYYLPPGYEADKDKRYPVIYWLHGLNGSPASANPVVARLDEGIEAGTAPEAILISCTDPTRASMWTDSKDANVPVETVIITELVPHVDSTFRTLATRQGRAIEGYSMGGYGAAYLGFKYPETFGAVSILSGALHSPESLSARRRGIFQVVFGGDADYAEQHSPWRLVRANAEKIRGRTFVRVHVGEKDGLKEWNENLHRVLGELRVEHDWFVIPNSTHSSRQFFANWPGNLFDFYGRAFSGPTQDAAKQSQPRIEEFVYKHTPQGDLKMQVHFPDGWTDGDQRPAIVFFFGGAWLRGSVEQFLPQAEYLAKRGMVTARADYRVKSRHGTMPDKCVEDGKSAVRWLRANAAGLGVDPRRIAAAGGSAGGHVAACTAVIPGFDGDDEDAAVSAKPNLLLLYNPVLDFASIGQRFGMEESARKISPNHHLTRDVPASIIFFGTKDRLAEGGKAFIQKAAELDIRAEMYRAPDQKHAFFNRPPWLQRTTYLADEFLARRGYVQGPPSVSLPDGRLDMSLWKP
jgi:acetyl esterase/lipase